MKRYDIRIPARFAPEIRFDLRPGPSAALRVTKESELEQLKQRLLRAKLDETAPRLNGCLRRAANEAAALAWVTPFPLLVFPALFEEKVEAAQQQAQLQDGVRDRSRELLAL